MARTKIERRQPDHRPGGFSDWVNEKLFWWIGPPPLGPYTDEPEEEVAAAKAAATCPICGELMSAHDVDRSGERTQIHHPSPEKAAKHRAAQTAPPEET